LPLALRKGSGRVLRTLPLPYASTVQVCLDHVLDIAGRGMVLRSSNILSTNTKAHMGKKQSTIVEHLNFSLWLSNRDLSQIFERSILVRGIKFKILYAMSNNKEIVWDLKTSIKTLNYKPQDGIK
jgi:hypothetical protein